MARDQGNGILLLRLPPVMETTCSSVPLLPPKSTNDTLPVSLFILPVFLDVACYTLPPVFPLIIYLFHAGGDDGNPPSRVLSGFWCAKMYCCEAFASQGPPSLRSSLEHGATISERNSLHTKHPLSALTELELRKCDKVCHPCAPRKKSTAATSRN